MQAVMICDAFGWTYEQYTKQPKWFIELLAGKRSADQDWQDKKYAASKQLR